MKRCRHKNRRFTGHVQVDLDGRGEPIEGTAKLIWRCCKCGKRVVR